VGFVADDPATTRHDVAARRHEVRARRYEGLPNGNPAPNMPDGAFRDRAEAGRALGEALLTKLECSPPAGAPGHGSPGLVVLGLARGGLPVAAEVADRLDAPLDVCVVRKLGAPRQPEFAFGAIAEDGVSFIDAATVELLGLRSESIDAVLQRELAELDRRVRRYRENRSLVGLRDAHVVLVDDGLATGATMRAALLFVKQRGAIGVTVAVPVGSPDAVADLRTEADVVCLRTPANFGAVGYWYRDFAAPSDDEIRELLA
jgi:putative phosphoribosyl transferase